MAVPTEGLVVRGTKVGLREKSPDDAWNDYLWRVDEELSELDAARPITMSFEQFVPIHREDLRYPTPRSHRFAIVEMASGKHIGNCMYYDLDTRRREAELGIMVGERAYWNGGYGSEAVNLLLEHMFEQMELHRVYLKTLDWNIRAQNAFAKCGFRHYGWGNQGRYRFMLMEVTRPEWEALRAAHDREGFSA
jgi:RimJ/RimL family protein N-acetyltransferase